MDKILGGKYSGHKIYCNGTYKYLYIKVDDTIIGITKRNVESYKLKVEKGLGDGVNYIIVWKDGEKSLIRIPKVWSEILVSGCEFGPLSEEESKAKSRSELKRIIPYALVVLIPLIALVLYSAFAPKNKTTPQNRRSPMTSKSNGTWAEWPAHSNEPMPKADMVVTPLDTKGDIANNTGYVYAKVYNNSTKTFSHFEAIYKLRDSSGEQFATCAVSLDDQNIEPNTELDYVAVCNGWSARPTLQLESVGFHE